MILVILAKHALESGINHRIVPNILGAAYIAGIRNFKGIYKFKGSCVLVHQILIVIRRSPLLGAVLCKPHRGPVKIWLGFADSNIIVKHIQIILSLRQTVIFYIGDRMLSSMDGKLSILCKYQAFILRPCPEGLLRDHIAHRWSSIDIINPYNRGSLPRT